MSELYQSLSHSKWDCKYHVVFVPKRRRRAIFGQTRRQLGQIFHALARQKECQIVEGHLMSDHVHNVHRDSAQAPGSFGNRVPVREERYSHCPAVCRERNFTGEHFWARGYAVSTVGFELEQVRQYIREQEHADGTSGQF